MMNAARLGRVRSEVPGKSHTAHPRIVSRQLGDRAESIVSRMIINDDPFPA
jgi:hypothetical protein